ncbi:hypothetical protein, partial [Corynebacterium casei]|uniref:hypothetical protein n=1 Tax=Corynebacterium casei TaxID=160386 RepID=UPI003FD4F5D4
LTHCQRTRVQKVLRHRVQKVPRLHVQNLSGLRVQKVPRHHTDGIIGLLEIVSYYSQNRFTKLTVPLHDCHHAASKSTFYTGGRLDSAKRVYAFAQPRINQSEVHRRNPQRSLSQTPHQKELDPDTISLAYFIERQKYPSTGLDLEHEK